MCIWYGEGICYGIMKFVAFALFPLYLPSKELFACFCFCLVNATVPFAIQLSAAAEFVTVELSSEQSSALFQLESVLQ